MKTLKFLGGGNYVYSHVPTVSKSSPAAGHVLCTIINEMFIASSRHSEESISGLLVQNKGEVGFPADFQKKNTSAIL